VRLKHGIVGFLGLPLEEGQSFKLSHDAVSGTAGYQWKFGRAPGCMREYTAKATKAPITTRRTVSHVDRDIRSSCLARPCCISAVVSEASTPCTAADGGKLASYPL
jgi:hypothetical protein